MRHHVPPHVGVRHSGSRHTWTTAIRVIVPSVVAAVLGGYALALGLTGAAVLAAAVAGAIAASVLMYALAE